MTKTITNTKEKSTEKMQRNLSPDYIIGYISGSICSYKNRVIKAKKALQEIEEIIKTYDKQREEAMKNWRDIDIGKPE